MDPLSDHECSLPRPTADKVREHRVASRAAFVQAALERERRRLIAARDAAILAIKGADAEGFDDLARYAAGLDIGLE